MYTYLNNQNIYYQKVGQGKDLILLHGWGNDVSTWWNVVDLLKNDFTLWLIDLPGFGRSDLPKKPFTTSDYKEIVLEFIKKQKFLKPNLLGHSLGGRIAIKLAANNPDLIDKLILESSAGIKPKRDVVKFLIYQLAKLLRFLPNLFNFKKTFRNYVYMKLEADYLKAGKLRETLISILKEDLTVELSKIKSETLLIWGEKDPTKEASLKKAKKMYQMIPNSRIEVLEDVGHFPHLESPNMFAYYVKDFS